MHFVASKNEREREKQRKKNDESSCQLKELAHYTAFNFPVHMHNRARSSTVDYLFVFDSLITK